MFPTRKSTWSTQHGGQAQDFRCRAHSAQALTRGPASCLLLPQVCQPHDLLPAPQPGVHTAFWGRAWAGGTLGGHPPRAPSLAPGTPSGAQADLTADRAARCQGHSRGAEPLTWYPHVHSAGLREGGLPPCPSPPSHTLCRALRPGQLSVLTPNGWGRARVAWQVPHEPVKKNPAPFRGRTGKAEPGTEGRALPASRER